MMLVRQSSFLTMTFRWRHDNLSGPSAEESLHLLITDLNSALENELHCWEGLHSISLRILRSTYQLRAVLNELCSTFHRLSRVVHGQLSWLIDLIVGSFLLLIQLVSFQGPRLLFATSWILSSKKDRLAFLTEFLNFFQFLRLLANLYLSRDLLQLFDHHCLECLENLDFFAFFVQA